MMPPTASNSEGRTLIDALLEEQRALTAVERFAQWHDTQPHTSSMHRALIPLSAPKAGEQYAFEVDLDRCSGCKSCVTACHALNGLDDHETWRSVGVLHGRSRNSFQQTITTACHHCVEPGCVDGCPVLAYDKDPLTGIVRHLDDQCIGCQYCIFMCPYEVPTYSAARGIVRKCDLCHQRLAHGEAPACVQACPSEAIRISVVNQETVRAEYRPSAPATVTATNSFLPNAPQPAITLPTTRYVSAKPLAVDLVAGDSHEARLQPAHTPLVWMLVLTQLGVGAFSLLPAAAPETQTKLSAVALVALLLGLTGSALHLGHPQKAWRAFLGLRRSWLSREIVVFSMAAPVAILTTLAVILDWPLGFARGLIWLNATLGLVGVLCSGMVYHVTKRECWRGEHSIGRFFGATALLGFAAAWGISSREGALAFAIGLALVTIIKQARELAFLRRCPDDADLDAELPTNILARSAFLMRFRVGVMVRTRLASGFLGGIALPLVSLLPISNHQLIAILGFSLCLVGEFIERALFFRAAVFPKMPGVST